MASDGADFSDDATQNAAFMEDELLEEEEGEEEFEDEADVAASSAFPPAPPGLKEVSSLACWTVTSCKPGCSVAALRSPTTSTFWQSDGPQPHLLNIHFFKIVSILGMRIYLDFGLDESYTPTLIKFAAGTGYNDLQEFSVMRFEQPCGWIDVDWEGVGDPADNEDENSEPPVLRCMLVQVRICENHQNGKDTHLRGLQLFAKDTAKTLAERPRSAGRPLMETSVIADTGKKRRNLWESSGWMDAPVLR